MPQKYNEYLLDSGADQFPRYCKSGQETTITPLACNEMKRANDGVVAESEIIIRGTEILPKGLLNKAHTCLEFQWGPYDIKRTCLGSQG